MTRLVGLSLIVAAVTLSATVATAQEPRLERLPDGVRLEVEAILDSARTAGLPTEPLVDRALEGASKRATGDRIAAAVRRLLGELRSSQAALGTMSSPLEIVAGASALRAGARADDLRRLQTLRGDQSVAVAAAVLADLVSVGVPPDTATVAVLTLAELASDAQYIAFRRSVERDVALGASAVVALGVRLGAAASDLASGEGTAPRRKP